MYKSGENDKEEDASPDNPELEVQSPAPELLEEKDFPEDDLDLAGNAPNDASSEQQQKEEALQRLSRYRQQVQQEQERKYLTLQDMHQ